MPFTAENYMPFRKIIHHMLIEMEHITTDIE